MYNDARRRPRHRDAEHVGDVAARPKSGRGCVDPARTPPFARVAFTGGMNGRWDNIRHLCPQLERADKGHPTPVWPTAVAHSCETRPSRNRQVRNLPRSRPPKPETAIHRVVFARRVDRASLDFPKSRSATKRPMVSRPAGSAHHMRTRRTSDGDTINASGSDRVAGARGTSGSSGAIPCLAVSPRVVHPQESGGCHGTLR